MSIPVIDFDSFKNESELAVVLERPYEWLMADPDPAVAQYNESPTVRSHLAILLYMGSSLRWRQRKSNCSLP